MTGAVEEVFVEPNIEIASVGLSESLEWDTPRARSAKVSFSSERLLMAVVEAISRSTFREYMDE